MAAFGFSTSRIALVTTAAALLAAALIAPVSAASKPAPIWEFTQLGVVVGPADVGLPTGSDMTGVSDESAVLLPDGRIRLYFNQAHQGHAALGIASAISSDGIHFTVESGVRVDVNQHGDAVGSGFVYPLPGGGYRFYLSQGADIISETSTDGLTFRRDDGVRLAGDAWGPSTFGAPVCSAIAKSTNNKYRMYCTIRKTAGGQGNPGLGAVVSAVSSDLLTWTAESGIRIGPGSNLPADAGHPSIVSSSASGAVTLVYHSYNYPVSTLDLTSKMTRNIDSAEILVSSRDGLSFSKPVITGVFGSEVAWVQKNPVKAFMYIGSADNQGGAAIGVATAALRKTGIGINFINPPHDATSGDEQIIIYTAAGATCTIRVKDVANKLQTSARLKAKITVPRTNLVSWSWVTDTSTAPGLGKATVTCKLGTSTRTRTTTFVMRRWS